MSEKTKFIGENEDTLFLKSVINGKNKDYKSEYSSSFHPSKLTECPRRTIYKINGSNSDNNYLNNLSIVYSKKKWIDLFLKMKSIQVVSENLTVADCHYNISGKVDAILKINMNKYVTQIHPICNEEFVKNNASKKDVVEIMTYMWLTSIKDGILLYENKDNNDYNLFHIEIYTPIINSIKKKCLELIDYKMDGKMPDSPYKSESKECLVCEFNKKCLGG